MICPITGQQPNQIRNCDKTKEKALNTQTCDMPHNRTTTESNKYCDKTKEKALNTQTYDMPHHRTTTKSNKKL